jgi:hypothetical protein
MTVERAWCHACCAMQQPGPAIPPPCPYLFECVLDGAIPQQPRHLQQRHQGAQRAQRDVVQAALSQRRLEEGREGRGGGGVGGRPGGRGSSRHSSRQRPHMSGSADSGGKCRPSTCIQVMSCCVCQQTVLHSYVGKHTPAALWAPLQFQPLHAGLQSPPSHSPSLTPHPSLPSLPRLPCLFPPPPPFLPPSHPPSPHPYSPA